MIKSLERDHSLRSIRRRWPKRHPQQTLAKGKFITSSAAAEAEFELVNSICMKDEHGRVSRNWVLAERAAVIKLDLQTHAFEGHGYELFSIPFLVAFVSICNLLWSK